MTGEELHIHVHLDGLVDIAASVTRMEQLMTNANDQLTALKEQLADTTADVLAKLDQLETQLGELPADAQATLDEIKAGVQTLDDAVGDADGSDTPAEPAE